MENVTAVHLIVVSNVSIQLKKGTLVLIPVISRVVPLRTMIYLIISIYRTIIGDNIPAPRK